MSSSTPVLSKKVGDVFRYFLVGIIGLSSIGLIVLLYANLDRGLDLTDESFYLLWVDKPAAYGLAASTFGFFMSPIYHLLGSSPAALRRFGLVVLVLTAMTLAWAIVSLGRKSHAAQSRFAEVAVALAVGSTVVTYYFWWLTTPAYNWLPLPAAFLLLTGLVLVYKDRATFLSAFLVGSSGMLAFAGKPTTAAGFALVYAIGMLILRGVTWETLRHFTLSAVCCAVLFLLAALTFLDVPLALTQARSYVETFGVAPAAGGFFNGAIAPWGYYTAMVAALAAFWLPRRIAKLCGVGAIVATASVVFDSRGMGYGFAQGIVVMTASLAMIANSFAWARVRPSGRIVSIVSLGHVLPWIVAFGTGNNLLAQASLYAALPLTSAITTAYLCFGPGDWRPLATALLAPLFAGAALYAADTAPYRLHAGLSSQEFPVEVAGGTMRVDAPTRDFIADLRHEAGEAGFIPGTPILDFTGDNPGIALLLSGQAPYYPWLVGGYDFSEPLVETAVGHLSPERRRSAWIVRNDAPRPFSLDFIASLGFDLESDYKVVATPSHPLYGEQVRLYAPVGDIH